MITLTVWEAKSFKEKVIGLLRETVPTPLLIKTRFGIHTFGMKFSIDILILDQSNRVASLKENLSPNRIFLWNPCYNLVVELPSGTIKGKKIKTSDQVHLQFSSINFS
ncbi:MAG: DUF192 domain-containing protein [Patescibacteria group bacterium]|nr:DUF192 domain-containing protein [Patescibacteria group bacterium]